MISRRWILLGLAGSALFDPAIVAAAQAEAMLPEDTARALDKADAAFSQRPQLHYNRKRQLRRQPHSDPARIPRLRRSWGRSRPARPTSRP